jgi:hypothetical protein
VVHIEEEHKEVHSGGDIDAMLLRMVSAPQIDNSYSEKNEHADSAMQRMSILTIKMRNGFNASCLSKGRLFLAESRALALAISANL